MTRVSLILVAIIICGLSAREVFCQADDAPSAKSKTHQLVEQAHGVDGLLRTGGSGTLAVQLALDLAGDDADVRKEALDVLRGIAGGGNVAKADADRRASFLGAYLQGRLLAPLLALKEYDLIDQLAGVGLAVYQDNTVFVDALQCSRVQALLGAGKGEAALAAAKSYYNVCLLQNTAKATALVSQALANTRAKTDKTVIKRFKAQQAAGAQPPGTTQPADLGEDVLKSIHVDAGPYEAALENFDLAPKDFVNLTAHGNLLLLADRPGEAKELFDVAVDLAADPKQMNAAVANVARAIRARDGNVGGANAYILSLRQQGDR